MGNILCGTKFSKLNTNKATILTSVSGIIIRFVLYTELGPSLILIHTAITNSKIINKISVRGKYRIFNPSQKFLNNKLELVIK